MSCITKTSAIILLGLLAHGGLLANESALSRTSAPTDSFHSFVSTTSEVSDHNPPIDPLTQARLGALRRRDAGSLPDVSGTEIAPAAVSSIVRRLVYHEIPMTTPAGVSGGDRLFAVSFNANRMAFFQYNPELNQNEIYVMNLDGSGIARVDSYTPTCNCNSQVDISADGSKILSWDGNQVLRLVKADGSDPHSVITIDGGYKYYRLSRDGSRVFFMVNHDWTRRPSGESRSAGLYVVNANGTALRQITNALKVAAKFGTLPGDPPFHWGDGPGFGLSADSQRIVFKLFIPGFNGQRLLRINSNGTGLRVYNKFTQDYYWYTNNFGISGDGNKVFYVISPTPCCSTPRETGVFNFDGTGKRVLDRGGVGSSEANMDLSHDGAKLNTGTAGRLINTDGTGSLDLAVGGGSYSTDPESIIDAYYMTMNEDASRFVYLDWCYGCGLLKPATLTINSPTVGLAPNVTNVAAKPAYVIRGWVSSATLSARVTATGDIVRVAAAFLKRGILDRELTQPILLDDGSQGDVKPGDRIYTSNQVQASANATLGARVIRIRAESRTPDLLRHATAADATPFAVK